MFAVNLDLKGRLALMVGAGQVGFRKLRKLLEAGALVRLVEPRPAAEIWELVGEQLEIHENFEPALWDGVCLAIMATSNSILNERLGAEARALGLWVNVADRPDMSNFFMPAVVERGELSLAVSTGGGSPALAAKIAERLREEVGPEYGLLAAVLSWLRPLALRSRLNADERRAIFQNLAGSKKLLSALAERPPDWRKASALLHDLASPVSLGEEYEASLPGLLARLK